MVDKRDICPKCGAVPLWKIDKGWVCRICGFK